MNTPRLLCCLLLASLTVLTARADEVKWRNDYAAARQEALEKERPLVLDFNTEDCYWCRQLESRTFAAPSVASLLNQKFVPLKVDAAQYPTLVSALNVQGYPTVVVASPAGKVLERQNGFLDAVKFEELLNRALTKVAPVATPTADAPPPDWMNEEYQKAVQATARSEFSKALPSLRRILQEERKHAVQARAAQLLQEIEMQAAVRLEQVKQLAAAGTNAEAVQNFVRLFDGTQAAAEGLTLLTSLSRRDSSPERTRQASELMTQAREDFRSQQYLSCLDRCEALSRRFSDSPEAAEAKELAAQVRGDAEVMQQICDTLPEWHGTLYLALAETKLKTGQPQQAVFYLERIIQAYPNTRHCEAATVMLSQIQGPPPLPGSDEPKP